MLRFIVMDVDGTLTDGKIYMGQQGESFKAFDVKDRLCTEIDNPEDLEKVKKRITEII